MWFYQIFLQNVALSNFVRKCVQDYSFTVLSNFAYKIWLNQILHENICKAIILLVLSIFALKCGFIKFFLKMWLYQILPENVCKVLWFYQILLKNVALLNFA